MNKIRYIYKITCTLDNKIYVGKRTCKKLPDPKYMGSGLLIGRYIRKYGVEFFQKEILEECSSLEQLNIREIFWIKELNSIFPAGLNISSGGEAQCDLRFHPDREEICKRISITLKEYNKNNPASDELKKKRSLAAIGIKKSPMTDAHRTNIKKARALQGATNKGRKFSKQWKDNLSKAHIGMPSNAKGKKWSQESKDKLRVDVICPHCNKQGKSAGMYSWHFDNCKLKK